MQREILELLRQQTVVPSRDLGQPVISNPEGAGLLRSEVIEAQRRHLSSAEQSTREIPTVTRDNVAVAINQDRHIEAKGLDAVGDLLDLSLAVTPRVAEIRFQLVAGTINDV